MNKYISWFGGAILGAGAALAVDLAAAPGDLVYEEVQEPAVVSGAKLTALTDAVVASGAWSGQASGLLACSMVREGEAFKVVCRGLKSAAPGAMPDKQVVVMGKATTIQEVLAPPAPVEEVQP